MKKILSLLIVCTMLTNSAFAAMGDTSADHKQMITKAFDSFRYAMTVDPRATDADYQGVAIGNFKQRMADLQASGVTAAELMDYMRNSILDNQTRAEFDRMLASMDLDRMSSDEAGKLAMQFMAKKYQEGANYSGGGSGGYNPAMVVVGVLIVGVITCIVIKHIKDSRNNDTPPPPAPCYPGNNSPSFESFGHNPGCEG